MRVLDAFPQPERGLLSERVVLRIVLPIGYRGTCLSNGQKVLANHQSPVRLVRRFLMKHWRERSLPV